MIELLYKALHSPFGLVVRSDNRDLLRQRLYKLRKSDPNLSVLTLTTSPENETDLWIVKTKEPTNAASEEP
jgi:hypothetical protein